MRNYAIVGTGSRSHLFSDALAGEFREHGRLVALCDPNQTRMDYTNRVLRERHRFTPLPTYRPEAFERMLDEQQVDRVIVTSIDRTHHAYIIRSLEAGRDVISEKPMTIDAARCRAVLEAVRRTGREVRVAFNYRYAPRNSAVKKLLLEGAVGEVKSVHFEWLLDTRHGADYFRRWHRDKANSGGLMVHKASHHFDLVNWWLDTRPETVVGMGGLVFYGRANAEARGETRFYDRGTGHPNAAGDPFALDLAADPALKAMYLDAEGEDGYRRDESVFGSGISIEDDMAVLVRYASGAVMSYHLTAYSPWEGFRIAFNGTRGRLEYEVKENSYVSGSRTDTNRPGGGGAEPAGQEPVSIVLRPHWQPPRRVPFEQGAASGHGGGDRRMLRDLFAAPADAGGPADAAADPLGCPADHLAGARAILTGIAVNRSFATGRAVRVEELL